MTTEQPITVATPRKCMGDGGPHAIVLTPDRTTPETHIAVGAASYKRVTGPAVAITAGHDCLHRLWDESE